MANNCYYEGHLVGSLKSIHAFIQNIGKVKPPYFYRVWNIDVNDLQCVSKNKKLYELYFSGECAWSISSTFATTEEPYNNLQKFTKHFDCVIEMYSEEEGCCFSEHILYNKGSLEIDNTVELFYISGEDFETLEEFKEYYLKHNPIKLSDKAFEDLYNSKESVQLGGHEFLYCDKLKYF